MRRLLSQIISSVPVKKGSGEEWVIKRVKKQV